MGGGWWHGVRPVRGRDWRARGGGRPGSTGAWSPQAEQPLDGGPGGDVSRKDAAGRASSSCRPPRQLEPRARAISPTRSAAGPSRPAAESAWGRRRLEAQQGGRARRRRHDRAPPWGAMSGPATGGGRVVEGQPAAGAALRARGAAETAAAAAGGRPRPHRAGGATGGVGACGPGGQRRGRRSATTPPRGRGDQAVAGASAVPRVLARSTAEPSRTLADSGDCISGTARNRRPTPSYSASIVGS